MDAAFDLGIDTAAHVEATQLQFGGNLLLRQVGSIAQLTDTSSEGSFIPNALQNHPSLFAMYILQLQVDDIRK